MSRTASEIVASMTVAEKASVCSGADFWNLKEVPGKLPSVMVTDGPHGLRKQASSADRIGLDESVPATCFPTAAALGSSWDPGLLEDVGRAIGEEARQERVAVVLGPGVNIKRSPLCGRNFEYYSEDPVLTGALAASFVRGLESTGVGSSLKHFAANNQESRRMTIDAVVDDRALREIYLAAFETPVKQGRPATVMCAYNRLNGIYCSEHAWLLTNVLRDEWGFEGVVITDWGAANDRVLGLVAGQDLEMPGNGGVNDARIVAAVRDGLLEEAVLDQAVERIVGMVLRTAPGDTTERYDAIAHHALARRAAAESAVLLKNDGTLPLAAGTRIAAIGSFAVEPRYQGSGSSLIEPHTLDSALDSLRERFGTDAVAYAAGYDSESEETVPALLEQAVRTARDADVVVVFAGLPEIAESEGFDRERLEMPESHTTLIEMMATVNDRVVVVLSNGSPVDLAWIDRVNAVLESYLGGEAWGSAIVDLLSGAANPSGRLAETFPGSLEQVAATPNFPGGEATVAYAESIYVGYRYTEAAGLTPRFPFGYGLSYTTFAYDALEIVDHGGDAASKGLSRVTVTFTVTNSGPIAGAEVAQVYVRDDESTVFRPVKELKGFEKVHLAPGETARVSIDLDDRAFSWWDSGSGDWLLEEGAFEILVGASSADIRLRGQVTLEGNGQPSRWARALHSEVPEYYRPDARTFSDLGPGSPFVRLLGRPVPPANRDRRTPLTRTSSLTELRRSLIGRILYRSVMRGVVRTMGPQASAKTLAMMQAVVREMPLRNLGMMSGGVVGFDMIDALLEMMNGRPIRGLRALLRARRHARRKLASNSGT